MCFINAQAQISNITASQRTDGSKLVDICYDLQGDENFSIFTISAEVSYDNGSNYSIINMVTGDIGNNIEEGAGKCLVWNFGEEAGELYTSTAKIQLTADSAPLPPEPGICTDYDGNSYETIQIGNQEWMAENLKTTHYNNGDVIPNITNNGDWGSLTSGAYGDYDNNPSNSDTYGRLYNWYTVDDERGVCPDGWHVPSDAEYKTLEMYLGMSQSEADGTGWRGTNEGSKLAGNANLWNDGNLENNAEFGTSGFAGVPSGYRISSIGNYYYVGNNGYFWSSTEGNSNSAWYRRLYYNNTNVYRNYTNKHYGFSVRCVRN